MKTTKLIFKLFLLSLVFISCSNEEEDNILGTEVKVIESVDPSNISSFGSGVWISAEGNDGDKDGSVGFMESDFSKIANFSYKGVNDAQLGGLIQSVEFNGDDAYIVLNDANSIVVVDRNTLVKKAVVTSGLSNPRYMTIEGGRGYVTNWGKAPDETDDYVAVLDLTTNKIDESAKIGLDNGVEQIVSMDNKLYVSHKGAWSSNNIISVVDLSDKTVTEITVNDNPDEIMFSTKGELIVLCEGKPISYGGAPEWDTTEATTSSISFIDVSNNTVTKSLEFAENVVGNQMCIDNGIIYYYLDTDNKVYHMSEDATELSTQGYEVGEIYGINFKDDMLYTIVYNFVDLTLLNIADYDLKEKVYEAEVGLGASKIYFNE